MPGTRDARDQRRASVRLDGHAGAGRGAVMELPAGRGRPAEAGGSEHRRVYGAGEGSGTPTGRKTCGTWSILLAIWFSVSYLAGISLADALGGIRLGGFPLGFWFANQGSEVIFVILIVVYVKLMTSLDREVRRPRAVARTEQPGATLKRRTA